MSARRISGDSMRSSTSRVTQSGRQLQPCSAAFFLQPSEQVMSAKLTLKTLPFSRRNTSCSRGVSYSWIRALPSGVSISVFFLGARLLKSLYASNS